MSFGKGVKSINTDDILSKRSEVDILNHYFGISTLPILINSPLRNDNNASLSIFLNDNDNIIIKDFGTMDTYNIWSFLMEYWGLSFEDTLERIYKDCNSISSSTIEYKQKHYVKGKGPSRSKVQCKIRSWEDYDLQFWEEFGINKQWLEFGDVYPISHVFITKDDKTYVFPAEKYAYAYIERKDGIVTMKIYQPKSTRRKWINNSDSSVWDLWTKLPQKGENLIITSSRKDALCLWANTGIPAISMQGEGYMPKQKIIDELKGRFNNLYIFFDNDYNKEENHGRMYAETVSRLFDIPSIDIPTQYEAKDPSDFYKKYGKTELQKLIKTLIK